ncbi:MAG: OmpH family outer membrane protein [Gemmatimonadota bacterium]
MRYTKSLALLVMGLWISGPVAGQDETAAATTALPPEGTAMVFVNTGAILPIAPGAEAAQAAFEVELQGFREELEVLSGEIDSMLVEYRRQEALMDPGAKDARQKEILDLQQSAQTRQGQLETQSEERRIALLEPILTNVRAVIEEMRAEKQYSIVFDIAESGVIAADPALDITNAVLARMGISPEPDTDGPR